MFYSYTEIAQKNLGIFKRCIDKAAIELSSSTYMDGFVYYDQVILTPYRVVMQKRLESCYNTKHSFFIFIFSTYCTRQMTNFCCNCYIQDRDERMRSCIYVRLQTHIRPWLLLNKMQFFCLPFYMFNKLIATVKS